MGILGTDYALRSGHVIFLLLVTSAVLLGFSYLNEMYQRIQLQETMERQMQHLVAERSIIQRRASLLQAQVESRNKEMQRQAFESEQQNSICEKERRRQVYLGTVPHCLLHLMLLKPRIRVKRKLQRSKRGLKVKLKKSLSRLKVTLQRSNRKNDLLETISSKEDTIMNVQAEYGSLKQRFDHLRSVMAQFENNQSRLLEKFSTQSTQCMNVINMLTKLCNKHNGNLIEKIAQVTKQNETFTKRAITKSSTSVNAEVSSFLVSPPQYFYETKGKQSTEVSTKRPPTKDNITNADNDKLNTLKAIQKLQKMFSELKDTKDEIMNLENIQYLTENVFEPTSEEEDLHKNVTREESQSTTPDLRPEQEIISSEKLPLMDSESSNLNQTKINKVDAEKSILPSKIKNMQLTNQKDKTEDKDIFTKEDIIDTSNEKLKIGEDDTISESKVNRIEKIVEIQKNPQKLILRQEKKPESYKENEESQYENNNEDLETDLELEDEEIPEIL